MSNKAKLYSKAFILALHGVDRKEAEIRIIRFVGLLKKHGDLKIAGEIISEIRSAKAKKNTVVSARPLSIETKEKIEKLLKAEVKERVNPDVIGGMALFLNNELLIDGTVKRKIAKIFS